MKFVLRREYYRKTLELKKIKNIVIAEIPTIEDVISEVIQYYNRRKYRAYS
jgi:hypothetical protein